MIYYDVFNGDADGILSLVQLRQIEPRDSILITGVKRDISLLKQVPVDGKKKHITVLDVSMEKNISALNEQLESGSTVFYADHHRSGPIPHHNKLSANINLDADTCTALIVDKLLESQKHLWAVAAAYGDNLIAVGDELSEKAGLTALQASQLQEFGTLINYNGYGESLVDLHFEPSVLFRELINYQSPFDCIEDEGSVFHVLKSAYQQDYMCAQASKVIEEQLNLLVIELENAVWARRISGVYGNELANSHPNKAIVVVTQNNDSSYLVSLRAPLNNKQGAGSLCAQYETGGGREAAAGVNSLPNEMLEQFIERVQKAYEE